MKELIFLLPCLVGFSFSIIMARRKQKTLAERFILYFLIIVSLFVVFDSYTVSPSGYPQLKIIALIFNAFFCPCIGIMICFVTWSLSTTKQTYRRTYLLFFLVSFLTFLVELMNYVGFGFDRSAELLDNKLQFPAECETDKILYHIYSMFVFFAKDVYNSVCAVCFTVSVIIVLIKSKKTDFGLVTWFNYLFRGGPLRVLHVWGMALVLVYVFAGIRIGYGSFYLADHPIVAMFVYLYGTLAMILLGIVGLYAKRPCLYIGKRKHDLPVFEDLPVAILGSNETEQSANQNQSETEKESCDKVASGRYVTDDEREDIRRLFREQLCFLYPGQSRYYVADMLGMHRSALDRLVRSSFSLSYAEYVQVQRVEYCRRYRRQYPNESEIEVSMACGFTSRKTMDFEIRECFQYLERVRKSKEKDKKIE